jgi:hypothetical protein
MAIVRLQFRRDAASVWAQVNPVLEGGEPGFESDTGKFKIGDGARNWSQLPYASAADLSNALPAVIGAATAGTSALAARADHSHALPATLEATTISATGNATIGGSLTVTGPLVGGSHQHQASAISNFSDATRAEIASALVAGNNITLTTDPTTGAVTVAATGGGAVSSVNGKTGAVVLSPSDVGAAASAHQHIAQDVVDFDEQARLAAPVQSVNGRTGAVAVTETSVNSLTGDVTIAAGANVTVTPSGNTLTIAASASGGAGEVTTVNSATGDITIAGSGLATVSTSGGTITVNASAGWADITGKPPVFNPAPHGHDVSEIAGVTERIQDDVGAMLSAGSGIAVTYNDIAGTATIALDATPVTKLNNETGDVTISGGTGVSVTTSGGAITVASDLTFDEIGDAPAEWVPPWALAVHKHTVLDISGLLETVQDSVADLLVAGDNITLTYDDAGNTLTIDAAAATTGVPEGDYGDVEVVPYSTPPDLPNSVASLTLSPVISPQYANGIRAGDFFNGEHIALPAMVTGEILKSADAETWTTEAIPVPAGMDVSAPVGVAHNGLRLVIVVRAYALSDSSAVFFYPIYRDGGGAWTVGAQISTSGLSSGPSSSSLSARSLAYGNGRWVLVAGRTGGPSLAWTSVDGATFSSPSVIDDSGLEQFSHVAYGNGTFVAVSSLGGGTATSASATSPNGTSWTVRQLPVAGIFDGGISFDVDRFIVVGKATTGSRLHASLDGLSWTTSSLPNDDSTYHAAYTGSAYVTGSNNAGGLYRSDDGVTWTELATVGATQEKVTGITFAGSYLLVFFAIPARVAYSAPEFQPPPGGSLTWRVTDVSSDGGFYSGSAELDIGTGLVRFTQEPADATLTAGTARFTAAVTPTTNASFQWEISQPGSLIFASISDGGRFAGATTAELSVGAVSPADTGSRFRVRVSYPNNSVIVSREAFLDSSELRFFQNPTSGTVAAEDSAPVALLLSVLATGVSGPIAYQWQTSDSSDTPFANVPGATSPTLATVDGSLAPGEAVKTVYYRCSATAGAVTVFSSVASLTFTADPPAFVAQPTSQTISGGTATFAAQYTGVGVTPSWERRSPGTNVFFSAGGAGVVTESGDVYTTTLALSGLTGNDTGAEYRVVLLGAAAQIVSESAGLVFQAPTISRQPSSKTEVAGVAVTFTVAATSGDGPVSYQWQEAAPGGAFADLPEAVGDTLTLGVGDVTLGRSGSRFRARVFTGSGPTLAETTSDAATLTVISARDAGATAFTVSPDDATLGIGNSYTSRAVSALLAAEDHYAFLRVRYDDGRVEYHPLLNGTAYSNTVLRYFVAGRYTEYTVNFLPTESCWITVAISSSPPSAYAGDNVARTVQPFERPVFCTNAAVNVASSPQSWPYGPYTLPVSFTCTGGPVFSVPDPPYTYVESAEARITVLPSPASSGNAPTRGLWLPPAAVTFAGAASADGVVVAVGRMAVNGYDGHKTTTTYLRSEDGGDTWESRNLPTALSTVDVIYIYNQFWVLTHYGEIAVSFDQGLSFEMLGRALPWGPNWRMSSAGGTVYFVQQVGFGKTNEGFAPFSVGVKPAEIAFYNPTVGWVFPAARPRPAGLGLYGVDAIAGRVMTAAPLEQGSVIHFAHGKLWYANNYSTDSVNWPDTSNPFDQRVRGDKPSYFPAFLQDESQNYVLGGPNLDGNALIATAPNGVATTNFTPLDFSQPGAGPQAGDWMYYTRLHRAPYNQVAGGMSLVRRSASDPLVEETLLRHDDWTAIIATPDPDRAAYSDVRIQRYIFGGPYGPNLAEGYWFNNFSTNVENAIFLPDRVLTLHRYLVSLDAPPTRARRGPLPPSQPR